MKKTINYNLKLPESTDYYNIDDQNSNMEMIDSALSEKVEKVEGKDLSSENYTIVEKNKLAGIHDWVTSLFSRKDHNHDVNYLKKADKASDSEKLDGKDSTAFANSNHNHAGVYENVISKKSGFNLDKSDSVTSSSSTTLATLMAVKTAYDKAVSALSVANSKETSFSKNTGFNLDKSNSVSSTSAAILATSAAVRTAYNKGVEALNKANTKLDATYGDSLTTSTSFTLNVGHKNRVILAGSTSNRVITLPKNIFSNGDQITIIRTGTGSVTFNLASGMTLHSIDNKRSIKDQYGSTTIVFTSASVAYLFGSLE